jgi:septum formation protein
MRGQPTTALFIAGDRGQTSPPMRISRDNPLVLGSASPRRREILESLRLPFEVAAADIDEAVHDREGTVPYLVRIVQAKLHAVQGRLGGELGARAAAVLVADTSVIVDGAILGKPADSGDARRMIERLAGRTHEVHTRFAIGAADMAAGAPLHAETVVTRVTFRPLSPAEARAYAESDEGKDKAGGYAVQGLGAALVSRIDGSYTNVVGLPACEVVVALGRLGLI